MNSNINKQPIHIPASDDSTLLRLVYKNEDIINEESYTSLENEKAYLKAKASNKLFVKEPLPLFDDYKFKYKDHDPL